MSPREVAQTPAEPTPLRPCAVCGGPLHPALVAAGETTHPTCEPPPAADPASESLDDTNRGEGGKGSGQPGEPSRRDQLYDSTEAPPPCPSCLHQTAGPPGRSCNTPDLHPTGVLL